MMTIRSLQVQGDSAELTITPEARFDDASLSLIEDRHGDGWHGASLSVWGPRGGVTAHLSLTVGQLRALAGAAAMTADWIEARWRNEPGPCLCHAWQHGPTSPCPNLAAEDSTYCRTCWTPDEGMQHHVERWAVNR